MEILTICTGAGMKITIQENTCVVEKEPGDSSFSTESNLFYHIKNILNSRGYTLVSTTMGRDEHSRNNKQRLLRPEVVRRKDKTLQIHQVDPKFNIAIYDDQYAIRNCVSDFNKFGKVELCVSYDYFRKTN